MINARLRRGWDRLMGPVGRALARSGLSPNVVTAFGILVQALVAWLVVEGRILVAGLAAIVAAIADALDGALARAQGTQSRFGALLDSTTDRLADALVFGSIAWLYGISPDTPARDEPWVALVALVTLVASFLVSYVKARAEALGFECNVGIAERAERLILVIAGLVFDQIPVMLAVLGALSIGTFVQRLLYARRQAVRAPADRAA
ncbi:MAG TPA: CDP-alcohol phosphatidyltransferase family protein [Actinomycetota bacterium]|nr:CDP-alcohol phosphatidyltransferase family protein [Actinomycetota bacterium]